MSNPYECSDPEKGTRTDRNDDAETPSVLLKFRLAGLVAGFYIQLLALGAIFVKELSEGSRTSLATTSTLASMSDSELSLMGALGWVGLVLWPFLWMVPCVLSLPIGKCFCHIH